MGTLNSNNNRILPALNLDELLLKMRFISCGIDVGGCQDGKPQAERVAALQERKQVLEALLNSRVGELKQVCLQEAVSRCPFSVRTAPTRVR